MMKTNAKEIINSAIITAFTIAAALILKDVIVEFIEIFFPPHEALFYKFIAAVASVILVVLIIYLIVKTEDEAEKIISDLKKISKSKRKKIITEIKKEAEKVQVAEQKDAAKEVLA